MPHVVFGSKEGRSLREAPYMREEAVENARHFFKPEWPGFLQRGDGRVVDTVEVSTDTAVFLTGHIPLLSTRIAPWKSDKWSRCNLPDSVHRKFGKYLRSTAPKQIHRWLETQVNEEFADPV
jgi:hypothetical protein